MEDYSKTVNRVRELLKLNTEWQSRFDGYINLLNSESLDKMKKARSSFYVTEPFHLYMNLTTAKNNAASTAAIIFELRFHGQSVAEVSTDVSNSDKIYLKVTPPKKLLTNAFNTAEMGKKLDALIVYSKMGKLLWHSDEAKDFRRIYLELDSKINTDKSVKKALSEPEHDMECELLKNYSQKSSAGKEILNIQPVMMGNTGARFQMPTAIKASTAKNGTANIEYSNSKQSGGGIDILARVGKGKGTKLAVLELKDSYSKSEPPEKVMHQAVAYATFIRELLKSDCGEKWWKFFGFGGNIPQKLEIKAIVVMPYNANAETDFGGMELPIDNDTIKLGYIYRSDIQGNQKICI